jgi:hypothetical protein
MANDVFISYSRKDQEFVTRLASDLDEKVAGVWFDKSDIQAGQKWRDAIMDGVRECKVFILVLSPDAAESKWVNEEVNKALALGKSIIPILYRPANLTGGLKELVSEIQYLDLRSGSYADNFLKLVDGIVAAGAARQTLTNANRPFLRRQIATDWGAVIGKAPGWGCAWSIGWGIFWAILIGALVLLVASSEEVGENDLILFITLAISGGIGGSIGGLIAGLITMIALRANAPSISWKHMSPSIRIWAISGPLGAVLSGIIVSLLIAIGTIAPQFADVDCANLSFGDCMGAGIGNAIGAVFGAVIIALFVFFSIMALAWFVTGMFAGWLAVRHIRTLEPGITSRQSWSVSLGWGCGTIVALIAAGISIAMIGSMLGLQ